MAGHSKWANIKHRKERADQKKGKVFSRIIKELISAVKQGGNDPKTNAKLRLVLQKAKTAGVPNENIERNLKKATSQDSNDYFEMIYELYGHGGVGIIAEVMTDNKNRIASEMRIATNKCGGNVAAPGAVMFNFDQKGVIQVSKEKAKEDELFLLVSENGAEDFDVTDDFFIITTPPQDLYKVKEALDNQSIESESSVEMIPKNWIDCSKEEEKANIALLEKLESIDDVDSVYHNMRFS